jgi:hypothetical protein
MLRLAGAFLSVSVLCGCGDDSMAITTPLRLTATVTPNPLPAPSGPGDVVWDLQLSASGSGSILILRGDAQLLDAVGRTVGQKQEFWSRCSVCTTDLHVEPGRTTRFSGNQIRYAGGAPPVRFVYTISYEDDIGPGTTTVEVPIR